VAVEWRDPPASPWVARIEPCMERPGCWAMVHRFREPSFAHQAARDLRTLRLAPGRPAGVWEFRSAGGEVFARYLGETA
jgi:hypothetical protein